MNKCQNRVQVEGFGEVVVNNEMCQWVDPDNPEEPLNPPVKMPSKAPARSKFKVGDWVSIGGGERVKHDGWKGVVVVVKVNQHQHHVQVEGLGSVWANDNVLSALMGPAAVAAAMHGKSVWVAAVVHQRVVPGGGVEGPAMAVLCGMIMEWFIAADDAADAAVVELGRCLNFAMPQVGLEEV